jgi:hypothetical protein
MSPSIVARSPLDSFNFKQESGSSDFDTRHNFTSSWSYDVPGSSHGPKILTHGWQVSAFVSVHTGQPFNFNSGTQRPGQDIISNPYAGVSHSFSAALGGEPRVNSNAFCTPGAAGCPGTTAPNGNWSRNALYGPGFADFDLSVFKNIPINERLRVQLRARCSTHSTASIWRQAPAQWDRTGLWTIPSAIITVRQGWDPGTFNTRLAGKIIF